MIVSAVVFSIVGLAILFLLGTAIYGIVWAAVDGLVSLVQDARDRLSTRTERTHRLGSTEAKADVVNRLQISAAEPPELSTEVLWHRMQGTSKKSHRRG